MKRTAIISGALTVVAFTALFLATGYRLDWLFVRWTDTQKVPFKVISVLEIASRWWPIKSGSTSLLCGEDGVHLMVKGRLPLGSYIRANTTTSVDYISSSAVGFDWTLRPEPTFRSFRIQSARVDLGSIDTIVSARLRHEDRALLLNWFERGAPQAISFTVVDESIDKLRATVNAAAVRDFLSQCRGSRDGN